MPGCWGLWGGRDGGLCAGAGRGERAEQRRRRAGALLLAG